MGGKKVAETQGPPINAKSKEEESFIKYATSIFPSNDSSTLQSQPWRSMIG
jgi:hypothetical protein